MADSRRFTGASGAEYEMAAKPVSPTPPRLQLARDIKAGRVKCWHFVIPEIRRTTDGREVTSDVRTFVRAQLAHLGTPTDIPTSIVALTPDGEQWLNQWSTE